MTLEFSVPQATFVSSFDLEIDETPNKRPCPPFQRTPTPCDDKITFPKVFGEKSVRIGDKLYTLKIEGVISQGEFLPHFITEERRNSIGYLVGKMSAVLVPHPQIKMVAVEVSPNEANWYVCSFPIAPEIPIENGLFWRFIVQNVGNVPLVNISVNDTQLGLICSNITLNPGESTSCIATSSPLYGYNSNTATVIGYYQDKAYTDIAYCHFVVACPPLGPRP